jgi:hypothetical protein
MAVGGHYTVNSAIGSKKDFALVFMTTLPFQTRSNPVGLHLSFQVECIHVQPFTMTFPSKDGSNYNDSIVALVLLPLIWIFISIRIRVRGFITKQLGWDDITAVVAVVRSCSLEFKRLNMGY